MEVENNIDWELISKAISFYREKGFTYKEVPWHVSKNAIDLTIPHDVVPHQTIDGYLVGSAEQSFLELVLNNKLDAGDYMAVTPCFRDDKLDKMHQRSFMKLELFSYGDNFDFKEKLNNICDSAFEFFVSLGTSPMFVKTHPGYDILINDTEIGSYYFKDKNNIKWACGTGLALPRFSKANEKR